MNSTDNKDNSTTESLEEKERSFYEMAFFLNPQLTDNEVNQILENFKEVILKNKGKIIYTEPWRLQRLAYPIKKNNEGYFSFIQFCLEKEYIKEIESYLLKQPDILRYLLIRINPKEDVIIGLEEKKVIPQAKIKPKKEEKKEELETIKISGEKELSLEELEKRIEEILKQ